MKKNRLMLSVAAILLAFVMMLGCTGCAGMEDLMALYGAAELEQLEEGQSIYELSIFDELPEDHAGIDPLFWVAEGPSGNKVYFLGSIHVADESAYRIPEYIMNAFLQSDALAVECDIVALETDIMAQYALVGYYMYTDGTTIQDHIDPELYEAMVDYFETYPSATLTELGYTVDILNQCKPNMWTSAFDMVSLELSGLQSELGIDSHFLNIAHSMGKNVIELESVEFQYQMLDNFPDALDEILLWSAVTSAPEESAAATRELFNAWKRGDAAAISGDDPEASEGGYYIDTTTLTAEELDWFNAVMSEYMPKLSEYYTDAQLAELKAEGYTEEYLALFIYYYRTDMYTFNGLIEEYNDAMITERNKGMANLADEMLASGQNVFYIVGAGHMVDYSYSDGIITQLRDMGYTVTQIGGMGKDTTYDLSYLFSDGVVPTTTVTSQDSTYITTTTTKADDDVSDSDTEEEYDYELYKEMYEYFGGTTRPEESTTTTNSATTTTTANSNNNTTTTTTTRAGNDGWGWSGSSN